MTESGEVESVRAGAEVDRLLETAPRPSLARESRASFPGRRSVLDPIEALHRDEGHWGELCELYLQRLDVATGDAERAKLLRRIGTILCEQLDDPAQALEAFVEALIHEPEDEETIVALEAIANALSAWEAVVRAIAARVDDDAGGVRDVGLCSHLVRWTKRYLERPEAAEPWIARIREIDPSNAIVHARMASVYRERGSFREQKKELETALLSARTSEERRLLHLALAELNERSLGDRGEAIRHLEAARAIDPNGLEPLVELERLYLAEERPADAVAILERHVAVAPDDEARLAPLLRLADLHERVFMKPERAAVQLEKAIAIDPNHAAAFRALERCYRAARSWPELARVLEVQARLATARAERLRVLAELAEVLESKMNDEPGAQRAHQRILEIDGRNGDALAAILRLCERAGDWKGSILARRRLAELAPTAEAKARAHVAIGEALAPHDAKQARAHFERAVAIDPACATAWDALVRDARAAGAVETVAGHLEQRIAHEGAPRLRAQLLVELADAHAALGDRASAESAEEDAIAVDPANEAAARRVLPRHLAAERWSEAIPLCERLAHAAMRDGDVDAAYAHRRTLARAALAMGDAPRAMGAALGAWELRPGPQIAADVIDVCHHAREDAELVTRARAALDAITAGRAELSPASVAKLGDVAAALGSSGAAAALFRQALDGDPSCAPALAGLTKLAQGPEALVEAAARHAQAAAGAETRAERHRLLVKAGELSLAANDLASAAAAFEDARAMVPRDHRVLHTLVWIYTEIDAWTPLSEILRSIADSEGDPVRRAKGIYAMALVLRDKIGDRTRAAAAFEQVLDLDPTRLEAFERLVRLHTERGDGAALAKSYERMIQRTSSEDARERKHALLFQLGLVYRDRLADVAHALQAFRAALALVPDDALTRKALGELLVIAGQTEEAAAVARDAIARRPDDPAPCAELYDASLRLGAPDQAWRALDAMRVAGGALDAVQERFHAEFAIVPLAAARASIPPPEWKRLFHPELDPLLTGVLGYATRAVLRSPRVRATRATAERSLGAPLTASAGQAARVVAAIQRGAQLLGVTAPRLYARKIATPLDLLPTCAGWLVSLEACAALDDASLAFLVGKLLAAGEAELLAAWVFPTVPELRALVGAAVHALDPSRADHPEPGPFDRIVRESMGDDERERVRVLAVTARSKGEPFDVSAWKRLADASAARVGLLLAGSLEGARKAMAVAPQAPRAMPPRELLQELAVMSLGDAYGKLREALGVGVAG